MTAPRRSRRGSRGRDPRTKVKSLWQPVPRPRPRRAASSRHRCPPRCWSHSGRPRCGDTRPPPTTTSRRSCERAAAVATALAASAGVLADPDDA